MSIINVGYDASGNGNNWTPTNIDQNTSGTGADVLVDVPTPWGTDTGVGGEVRGNYCTWNSAAQSTVVNGTVTRSNGNLESTDGSTTYGLASFGTIAVSSGKWYWEIVTSVAGGTTGNIGVVLLSSISGYTHSGQFYQMAGYLNSAAYNTNTSAYGASYTVGDVIGVALDMDAGTVTFYKNGTSQGQAASGLSGYYSPAVGDGQNAASYTFVANFGQRPFAYTAPSGFKALCTQNLPDPAIADGGDYMNAVLWTGNGTSSRAITGLEFQPDFVWGKVRSTNYGNVLYDAVRGANKRLSSNSTDPEDTISPNTNLISFDSDGFTVGSAGVLNESTQTYVAWNWKAGGAGVTNTAGTITSTVSANTTAGFSIVTYTGVGGNGSGITGTVGHGLGATPKLIFIKIRNSVARWFVYHGSVVTANNQSLHLDETSAIGTTLYNPWVLSNFNSTTFGLGDQSDVNNNGSTYVAYCFAPIAGYSAFGSYTGNGSSDGSFIFCNFRPRWIMVKQTNASGDNWAMYDTLRSPYNICGNILFANLSDAENSGGGNNSLDILSNGFKWKTSLYNGSGSTYIYAAFAENPFKYALAR